MEERNHGVEMCFQGLVPLMSSKLKLLLKAVAGGARLQHPAAASAVNFAYSRPAVLMLWCDSNTVLMFTVGSACFELDLKFCGLN